MKKTISLILALLVVCAMMTAAFTAFADESGDESEEEILDISELKRLIDHEVHKGKDTITLTHDYQVTERSQIPIINDRVIIDGNGHTIYSNGNRNGIEVTVSGVLIKNLNFVNFSSNSRGAAIYFEKRGAVENCSFTDYVGRPGVAISFGLRGQVLYCKFVNCSDQCIIGTYNDIHNTFLNNTNDEENNGAAPAPSDNSDDPAFPTWVIVLIASAAVVICGTAAFIIVKKKKKTAE